MLKCLKCGKTFIQRSHLVSHASKCRGVGVQCPICGNVYPSIQALRLHVRRGHGDLWSRCPICNREYKLPIVHYSKMGDEKHRALWIVTTTGRKRTREPSSIRKLAEKYSGVFRKNELTLDQNGDDR